MKRSARGRWWYVAASVVLVLGLAATGLFVWQAVRAWPGTPVDVGTSGVVRLDRPGLTLYNAQEDSVGSCVVVDGEGRDLPMKPYTGESISVGERRWYSVSRSVDPVLPGDYRITCDADGYAVGPRGSILAFVVAIFAILAAAGLTLTATGALLTIGILRHISRRPPIPLRPNNHLL